MRRGTMLVVGLLLASTAMPHGRRGAAAVLENAERHDRSARRGWARAAASRRAHHSPPRDGVPTAPAAAIAAAPAAAVAATGAAAATRRRRLRGRRGGHHRIGSGPSRNALPAPPKPVRTPARCRCPFPPRPSATPRCGARTSEHASAPASLAGRQARRRAQSRLGTVGPLAWPTAYEDVIGFTLWPKEYGERLRVHGIGDVLSHRIRAERIGCRQNAAEQCSRRGPTSRTAPRSPPTCGSVDLTSADWPIAQIASAIELERRATRHARSAQDGVERCGVVDQVDLPQRRRISRRSERLRAMQNTLWAVHDAAQLIRAPLAKFYDSLTEEQKQKFAAPAPAAGGRAAP